MTTRIRPTKKTHKVCRGCNKNRRLDFFVKNGRVCNTCRAGRPKREQLSLEAQRRLTLWSRYRMTEQDVVDMLLAQDSQCKICSTGIAHETLRIDHDHETGEVRGLLCNFCNSHLIRAFDTVATLPLSDLTPAVLIDRLKKYYNV